MGFFDKFERSIDGAVNNAFARVFKGDVQPVEIATRLVRELDAEARLLSRERRLVPNEFLIGLSQHDYDRLAPYAKALNAEIIPELRDHASQRGYVFNGPIIIYYELDAELPTGRFSVASRAAASVQAPPQAQAAPQGYQPEPNPYDEPQMYREAYAPAAPEVPEMDVVLEVNGVRHPLNAPGFVIGRGSDADVRINDPGISRRHAQFEVHGEGPHKVIEIVDLGSTNGVTVNGQRVNGRLRIGPGARIEIGTTRMLVHIPQAG